MPPGQEPPDIDPAALARAEAAVAGLSERYLSWAAADLVRLEDCLAPMLSRPEEWSERLGPLFAIVHDMKGQGATFDYPLVSELGRRLCRLLESSPDPTAKDRERVAGLAAAMGRVIRERLAGDGGEEGRRLLADCL